MSEGRGIEVNWMLIRGIVAFAFVGAGLLLLGLSVYGFLRVGEWGAPSLADLAFLVDGGSAFLREWVGLAKILGYIPLWLALMAVGYFIAIAE